jgi:hypothetical protein
VEEVELGLCRAVAVPSEVVTDPLDSIFEKVALLRVKRNAVALKELANAPDIKKDGAFVGAPKEGVVDYVLAANGANGANGLGVAFGKESVPFGLEDAHHCSVDAGCIAGSERHDIEAVVKLVGCKKRELLTVAGWTAIWWYCRFPRRASRNRPSVEEGD